MAVPRRLGGFADAARELSAITDKKISRQQVYTWWKRRSRNGFPERHKAILFGKERDRVDLDEVLAWYPTYEPSKGGARRRARAS